MRGRRVCRAMRAAWGWEPVWRPELAPESLAREVEAPPLFGLFHNWGKSDRSEGGPLRRSGTRRLVPGSWGRLAFLA